MKYQKNETVNFSDELNRIYPDLLKLAIKLAKTRDEGYELLQQTIYELCNTHEKMAKMEHATEAGYLKNRIALAIYIQTKPHGTYNRNKPRSREFHEQHQDIFENLNSKLSNRIANEQIDLLISRLPDFEAELLRLWCMPEFNYRDASEATGLTIGHLKKINHKSIQKIRKYVSRTTPNSTE